MYKGTTEAWIAALEAAGATGQGTAELGLSFLSGQGYTSGTLDDRWYQYLSDKGYGGTLQDAWYAAVLADDLLGGGGAACAIALSDSLAGFGYASFDISGQSVSITSDGASNYAAGTPLSGDAVDWSGIRIVEGAITSFDASDTAQNPLIPQLVRVVDFYNVAAQWVQTTGKWKFALYDGTGSTIGFYEEFGSVSDNVAIGIDGASGDVTFYRNGTLVADKNTTPTSGLLTDLGGMFLGQSVAVQTQLLSSGAGTVYAAALRTASGDIKSPPSGGADWCGNAL